MIAFAHTIPVKEQIVGKRYVDVVNACLSQGLVPLGLFRHGARKNSEGNSDVLPYVYSNCRQGDIVNEDDLIFVLRNI